MPHALNHAFLAVLLSLYTTSALAIHPDSPVWQKLTEAEENSWVRLNRNTFEEVWTPKAQRPAPASAPTVGNPSKVILAWGSFAWDSNRGDLIFHGGGHAGYPGNEVYRWRSSTLEWERASLPSELEDVGSKGRFVPVDGMLNAPTATHTYDNTGFLSLSDRYYSFGGAAFNSGRYYEFPDGRRTGPYFWDPELANADKVGGTTGSQVNPALYPDVLGGEMWDNRDNLAAPCARVPRPGKYFINTTTAAAVEDGRDVVYVQNGSAIHKYTVWDVQDAALDSYEKVGRVGKPFSGQGAGAIDAERKLYVRSVQRIRYGRNSSVVISAPTFVYWDLSNPGAKPFTGQHFMPEITGEGFDMDMLWAYGMDFDRRRGVFLMWGGQGDVWALRAPQDPAAGRWSLEPVLSDGAHEVEPQTGGWTDGFRGVIGSWKYAPELDVFFGVSDGFRGDIWAYKPHGWKFASTADAETR